MLMKAKNVFDLLKATCQTWYEHEAYRLGAALSYYLAFSLAPILIVVVALASLVYGESAAQGRLVEQIETTVGAQLAKTIEEILSQSRATGSGTLATVVSITMLLFSATAVFAELHNALDTLWDVRPKSGRGWWGVVKVRFWSFMLVLVVGALLLASLAVSAVVSNFFPSGMWRVANVMVSLGLITVFVATIYKILPDVILTWWDVWVGAAATAILFTLGKYLIGLYLGKVSLTSPYGVAGSLAIILLWVYYSSQVLLFGAAFTKVYANKYGKPMTRAHKAEPLTEPARARQGMATPSQS
ncbi:MAG: YihY/virulence factor BrkB family protein [Phycisphaerae bacterium]|nr:YihY/virulence factor BrkB family protein [Phycisphaerae bacterium]